MNAKHAGSTGGPADDRNPPSGSGEQTSPGGQKAVLGRLLRELNVELDRFSVLFGDAHGLHRTDLNALVAILDAANRQDPLTPSRLAAALDLSTSATTALLTRLESLGHITREHSSSDRRRVDLDIQDTARQIGGEFFRPLQRELDEVWDGFDEQQRDTIQQFLAATIDATARAREGIESG